MSGPPVLGNPVGGSPLSSGDHHSAPKVETDLDATPLSSHLNPSEGPSHIQDHVDPVVDQLPSNVETPHTPLAEEMKQEITVEGTTINSGLPFPSAIGNVGVIPSIDASSSHPHSNHHPDHPDSSVRHPSGVSNEKIRGTSSNSSSSLDEKPSGKAKKGFFSKRKDKDEQGKKAKQKEAEADAIPPVSFFALFRYAKPHEIILNIIGCLLAAASGAAQPLMTLIFGRLTESFTNYGREVSQIAALGLTPESAALLKQAQDDVKFQSGRNAIYLMIIGVGMFLATWAVGPTFIIISSLCPAMTM